MLKPEDITIKYKKLGRNKALGLAYKEENLIYLDPKLKGKDFLNVMIHELFHLYFPYLEEDIIDNAANGISQLLSDQGVMKTEADSKIIK